MSFAARQTPQASHDADTAALAAVETALSSEDAAGAMALLDALPPRLRESAEAAALEARTRQALGEAGAVDVVEAAIDRHGATLPLLMELARIASANELWSRADEAYRRILEARPNHFGALRGRYDAAIALQDDAAALNHARTMAQRHPRRALARRRLGQALVRVGRADDAVTALAEACADLPGEPGLRVELANACRAAGDLERARRELDAVRADAPDLEAAYVAWIALAEAARDGADLSRLIEAAAEAMPDNATLARRALTALRGLDDLERARAEAARLVARFPEDDAIALEHARVEMAARDYPAAIAAATAVLERSPGHARARDLLVRARQQTADRAGVLDALQAALAATPDDDTLAIRLGEALFDLNRLDEAFMHMQSLIMDAEDDGEVRLSFMRMLRLMGDFETFDRIANANWRTDSHARRAWRERVQAARARSDPEATLRLAERGRDTDPAETDYPIMIAEALGDLGEIDEAAASLRTAIEAAPGDDALREKAGRQLTSLRAFVEAKVALSPLLTGQPSGEAMHAAAKLVRLSEENPFTLDPFREQFDDQPDGLTAGQALYTAQRLAGDVEGARATQRAMTRAWVQRSPLANVTRLKDAIRIPGPLPPERVRENMLFAYRALGPGTLSRDAWFERAYLGYARNTRLQQFTLKYADEFLDADTHLEDMQIPFDHSGLKACLETYGKGCIVATTHHGPLLLPVLPWVSEHTHIVFGSHFERAIRGGMTIRIGKGAGGVRALLRELRKNKIVASAADVNDGSEGHTLPFLGGKMSVATFHPRTAHKLGIETFWFNSYWEGERIAWEIEKLPGPNPGESVNRFIPRWAAAYAAHLERFLRKDPINLTFHDMWRQLVPRG